MSDKTMVNVSFPNEVLAQIDRHRAGGRGRPEVKRAAWVAWATAQFIATLGEQEKPPSRSVEGPKTKALRELVAADAAGLEGARLRAARETAGLTQPELAAALSSESVTVSRNQIHRAERALHLDGYPALRAWLQAQEMKA